MDDIVRQARKEDVGQMLEVYNNFARQFVGAAQRSVKNIRRNMREKDGVNWVALDDRNEVIGYVHAHFDRGIRQGEFREIVVDPKYNFVQVAKTLIEEVNEYFMDRKAAAVVAGSVRNPDLRRLFPKMGFFESESLGVFMHAILDVPKFLNEFSLVLGSRLSRNRSWSGVVQLDCEGCSIFLSKSEKSIRSVIWTNQGVNFKVTVTRALLTKLVFGAADAVESYRSGELTVEGTEGSDYAVQLLRTLFPRTQFLIMDYW